LCSQGAGSKLCKRETLKVVFFADPAALVDEVLLHVSGKSNRAAESYGSEPQEIANELSERHSGWLKYDGVGF